MRLISWISVFFRLISHNLGWKDLPNPSKNQLVPGFPWPAWATRNRPCTFSASPRVSRPTSACAKSWAPRAATTRCWWVRPRGPWEASQRRWQSPLGHGSSALQVGEQIPRKEEKMRWFFEQILAPEPDIKCVINYVLLSETGSKFNGLKHVEASYQEFGIAILDEVAQRSAKSCHLVSSPGLKYRESH